MDSLYHQRLFCHYFMSPEQEKHYDGICREDGYFISFKVLGSSLICDSTVMRITMSERMSWIHPCVTTSVFAVMVDGGVSAWLTESEVDCEVSRLLEETAADAWIDAEMSDVV